MREYTFQEYVSYAAQMLAQESNGNLSYTFYAAGNDLMLVLRANIGGKMIELGNHVRATPDGKLLCSDPELVSGLEARVSELKRTGFGPTRAGTDVPLGNAG